MTITTELLDEIEAGPIIIGLSDGTAQTLTASLITIWPSGVASAQVPLSELVRLARIGLNLEQSLYPSI